MKTRPTKAQLREQLAKQVQSYLEQGGEIEDVEMGATGLENGKYNMRNFNFEPTQPGAQNRTPVGGLLGVIDSRKGASNKPSTSAQPKKTRSKKKPIYDDFGEVLRWVWVDE